MPWIWFDTIDEGCQRKIEMIFRSQIIGVRVLPWDGNFTLTQWVDKHTATHRKIHHYPYYFCEIFMPPSLSPRRQDTHPSWLLNVEWHGHNWVRMQPTFMSSRNIDWSSFICSYLLMAEEFHWLNYLQGLMRWMPNLSNALQTVLYLIG